MPSKELCHLEQTSTGCCYSTSRLERRSNDCHSRLSAPGGGRQATVSVQQRLPVQLSATGSRVDVPPSVEAALRNVQAVHMELERLIVDVARSKRLR